MTLCQALWKKRRNNFPSQIKKEKKGKKGECLKKQLDTQHESKYYCTDSFNYWKNENFILISSENEKGWKEGKEWKEKKKNRNVSVNCHVEVNPMGNEH